MTLLVAFEIGWLAEPWQMLKADQIWTGSTDEAKLRELQDHPVLRRELQGKVLHSGKVVGLSHNVILQLQEQKNKNIKNRLFVL